jgi:16S rRNA (cytosine1402-N4)-methyltransferase
MVEEVLQQLDLQHRHGLFLDGTVGGGGHARALLEQCAWCRVLAVDRDPEALEEARRVLREFDDRVRFLATTFDRAIEEGRVGDETLTGALLDLGLSSRQLDEAERGFAFRPGIPLDMRMAGARPSDRTAADLLNEEGESRLAKIFRDYGEEPRARRLAREVVRRRARAPLRTSDDLVAALRSALGRPARNREKARIFQALRIAVNDELNILERALPVIRRALRPEGTLAVISYHSLEDRRVKLAFREWSRSCVCPAELPVCRCRGRPLGSALTRRPIQASDEEVSRNPRARSARLRAWRKAA